MRKAQQWTERRKDEQQTSSEPQSSTSLPVIDNGDTKTAKESSGEMKQTHLVVSSTGGLEIEREQNEEEAKNLGLAARTKLQSETDSEKILLTPYPRTGSGLSLEELAELGDDLGPALAENEKEGTNHVQTRSSTTLSASPGGVHENTKDRTAEDTTRVVERDITDAFHKDSDADDLEAGLGVVVTEEAAEIKAPDLLIASV